MGGKNNFAKPNFLKWGGQLPSFYANKVVLVEEGLQTPLEHLSSPLVFSGVCIAQSSVFCVIIVFSSLGQ